MNLTINLDNIAYNYRSLSLMRPMAEVAAVVKADGYGLGAEKIVERLIKEKCSIFFVATLEEAEILSSKFNNIKINILEGFRRNPKEKYITYTINKYLNKGMPVINNIKSFHNIPQFCREFILHIDTGMNRLGLRYDDILSYSYLIKKTYENGDLIYIMTHMACADDKDHPMNDIQKHRIRHIKSLFPDVPISVSNSYSLLNHPDISEELARPGIALYGGIDHPKLKHVVSFHADILEINNIKEGDSVGYGSEFTAKKDMRIITVSGGYADGIPRSLSGSDFCAYFNGYRLPLLGRVSMDSMIFDISDVPDDIIDHYSKIEIIGDNNTLEFIANKAKTISYEILTGLGNRFKREYIQEDDTISTEFR